MRASLNAGNRAGYIFVSFFLAFAAVFFFPKAVWAQAASAQPAVTQVGETGPASYVGATLSELVRRLGIPKSVHTARGLEEWQDDVVFVYAEGDFFILEDRVWQVRVQSAFNISPGDSKSAVYLGLGEAIAAGAGYEVFRLGGRSWPMAVRVNFDPAGKVTEFFIFRSDL